MSVYARSRDMNPQAILCYVDGDRAWFTTAKLEDQWGDDWDDAPYEHNAGRPYAWAPAYAQRGIERYELYEIVWDAPFEEPDFGHSNSPWSVQRINAGQFPWLRPTFRDQKDPSIMAGTTMAEFIQIIANAGGTIFMPIELHRER